MGPQMLITSLPRDMNVMFLAIELDLRTSHLADRHALGLAVGTIIGQIMSSDEEKLLPFLDRSCTLVNVLNSLHGISTLMDVTHCNQVSREVMTDVSNGLQFSVNIPRA